MGHGRGHVLRQRLVAGRPDVHVSEVRVHPTGPHRLFPGLVRMDERVRLHELSRRDRRLHPGVGLLDVGHLALSEVDQHHPAAIAGRVDELHMGHARKRLALRPGEHGLLGRLTQHQHRVEQRRVRQLGHAAEVRLDDLVSRLELRFAQRLERVGGRDLHFHRVGGARRVGAAIAADAGQQDPESRTHREHVRPPPREQTRAPLPGTSSLPLLMDVSASARNGKQVHPSPLEVGRSP